MKRVFQSFFIMIFVLCALAVSSELSAQDVDKEEIIKKVESYLNNMKTAKARFVMQTPGGALLPGNFYLKKPGRLRFEYDDPVEDFIVADGTFIYFYDAELQSQAQTFVDQTLAAFIVRDNIKLDGNISVMDVFQDGNTVYVMLTRKDDPDAGSLTLQFNMDPFTLIKWEVLDAEKNITSVTLRHIEQNILLDNKLFYFIQPKTGKPMFNE